jgi:hypothetical protein
MANDNEKPSKLNKVLDVVKSAAANPMVQLIAVSLFKKLTKKKK